MSMEVTQENQTAVVRLGVVDQVEATFSRHDDDTKRWLRKIAALARGRRLRAPLVVGLVALRGLEPNGGSRRHHRVRRRPRPTSTVRCIALCVGGAHALVYQPGAPWEPLTGATGRIQFDRNKMRELSAFLGDARVTVACLGADDAAAKLAASWGLHVAGLTDLRRLVERAYGREVEASVHVDGRVEKRRVSVRGLDVEGMAALVLGQEMQPEKTPAKVAQADWGSPHVYDSRDELMYAVRDAYLCFEIAARCLQKLGAAVA
ncbi:hypothetical protein ACP70R_020078 [Stipagrostis hirtigluma subsp. patula]